ncbi:MAG: hypothetical protein DMD75_07920 [Candidatus Rokuibacteriota bacterium]|nr:MAG: hypothetical protein DMD75_07920 [Candidatus Rokubacteria bacterium]
MLNGERSILIVVPRGGQDACRSLSHTFADDSTVEVIVDRRLTDRRSGNGAHRPERRQGDRRTRPDADAELKVDRWIAVPRTTAKVDFDDPDSKAILFLCCSQHIVPCQRCQNTYRLGWVSRSELGVFPCPLCGSDLTSVVTAHAQVCSYWANRSSVRRPLSRVGATEPSAQAATG